MKKIVLTTVLEVDDGFWRDFNLNFYASALFDNDPNVLAVESAKIMEMSDDDKPLNTHEEAALLVDIIEDFLEARGVKPFPSEYDEDKDPENDAIFYGEVFDEIASDIEETLIKWLQAKAIPYTPYVFD